SQRALDTRRTGRSDAARYRDGHMRGVAGKPGAEGGGGGDFNPRTFSAGADLIFTHDPFSAESALRQRASSQQVWMMCHGVTPIVLYAVWSWGIPEADWRSFLDYPDVRTWIDWELDVWSRVDRVVFPCPEATESFRIIDLHFDALADP